MRTKHISTHHGTTRSRKLTKKESNYFFWKQKGEEGDKNGSAFNARLSNPQDITLYKNVMYISETGNACVKKLSKGKVRTFVLAFSLGDGRELAEPCDLAIQSVKLYIGDIFTENLLEVAL